jgi:hypothetical protein
MVNWNGLQAAYGEMEKSRFRQACTVFTLFHASCIKPPDQ